MRELSCCVTKLCQCSKYNSSKVVELLDHSLLKMGYVSQWSGVCGLSRKDQWVDDRSY